MFTKTDLAKFENVWDDHPKWVNLGAQKNFARYAGRVGKEWRKSSDGFNEFYYRRAIARGLIFRSTEKLVSEQPWYNGGYRANIVAYAISSIKECCRLREESIDYSRIWNSQAPYPSLIDALAVAAKFVHEDIAQPPQGISNISEWCKKDACWERIQSRIPELQKQLPKEFLSDLVSLEDHRVEKASARTTQKIDNGIDAQKRIFEVPAREWSMILKEGVKRKILTPKEIGILKVAEQMPSKIPTEKQSAVLVDVLAKAAAEGLLPKRAEVD